MKKHRVGKRHTLPKRTLSFGELPPYGSFVAGLRQSDDEGREYLPKGRKYPMELGRSDERIARKLRLRSVGPGDYGKPRYELSERQLYNTIGRLARMPDEEANSLASGIMQTLGYEWI